MSCSERHRCDLQLVSESPINWKRCSDEVMELMVISVRLTSPSGLNLEF